jgi:hypothetical protein
MERQTERVIEETGVPDPLADRDPKEPDSPATHKRPDSPATQEESDSPATHLEPEEVTPDEGVEPPGPPEPDPEHVVEEKQRDD